MRRAAFVGAVPAHGGGRSFTGLLRSASTLVNRGEGMTYSKHLVDRRRLLVAGGNGGKGGCQYTKHKKHEMVGPGYPCGGSGGKGGDVVVQASDSYHSLAHLVGTVHANSGRVGRKGRINGASGTDAMIWVPRGVIVRELLRPAGEEASAPSGDSDADPVKLHELGRGPVLADLDQPGASVVAAAGGSGGRGNTMHTPYEAAEGLPGQSRYIELEMKTIADVGLVGMPNAGKSSLLGAVSRACPKIAPYPFTTVAPYVGRAEFVDDYAIHMADVPGLVEGAHLGEGMGHEFLRHLERTKVLLYVVDVAHAHDPLSDLAALQNEVAAFSWEMAMKPCGVVATKCDLSPDRTLARVDELFHGVRKSSGAHGVNAPLFVRAISARFGDGVKGLLQELRQLLMGTHAGWLARAPAQTAVLA